MDVTSIAVAGIALFAAGCVTTVSPRRQAYAESVAAPDTSPGFVPEPASERRGTPPPFTVRFVYLVPADRTPREEVRAALEANARQAQAFFRAEVGATFALDEASVVEVVRSARPAAWFCGAPTTRSENPDDRCYYNSLDELRATVGGDQHQEHVWFVYADTPGDLGRAVTGVAVVQHDEEVFSEVVAGDTGYWRGRWTGGLIHELGHALGLPERPDEVMMGTAWHRYPGAHLTPDDVAILRASPFFGASPAPLATYAYDGGRFERTATGWMERTDRGAVYLFVEASDEPDGFVLASPGRGLQVRIPRAGGASMISSNGGAWTPLYALTPQP